MQYHNLYLIFHIFFLIRYGVMHAAEASQRYVWIGKMGAGRIWAGVWSPSSTNSISFPTDGGTGRLHLWHHSRTMGLQLKANHAPRARKMRKSPATIKPIWPFEMPWAKFSTPMTRSLSTPAKRGFSLGRRTSGCRVDWFIVKSCEKIKKSFFIAGTCLANNCLPFVSIILSNYFSLLIVKVVRVFWYLGEQKHKK